jgi:hypothetical protein
MLLATAVIPRIDLARLVESITPLRVTIDEERGRVITLGRAKLELVPEQGLRLRGNALLSWDFARVPFPVTIKAWQLLLVPRVLSRAGSHVLSFEPVLEHLDVKLVRGFVDERIADAIRDAIAQRRHRLAWDFARMLSKRLPLPPKISPANTFEIFPVGGEVSVDESELRLLLRFEARFELHAQFEQAPAEPEVEIAPEQVSPPAHLPAPLSLRVDARRRPRRRLHPSVRSRTLRRGGALRVGRVVG